MKIQINKASIKEDNKVQWGITAKNPPLEVFSQQIVVANNSSSNQKLDRFQETGINPL